MERIENLLKNGEYNLALSSIEELLVQDEYNIEFLEIKAQVLYKLESFNEVIKIYNTLINLSPKNAENYAGRGLTYHSLGDKEQSLDDFSTAIELEPDNGYRYSSRAFIKDYLGDYLGAVEDYNKAVELNPEDAVSLNNRGLVEEKLGRLYLSKQSFASADKLVGIDNPKFSPLEQPTNERSQKRVKLDFNLLTGVIRDLFSSEKERKKFFNFLFRRDQKRKS